jgi:hypothetical protein
MKLPHRRQFLHLAAGAAAAGGGALRLGASVSDAAGALSRRCSRRKVSMGRGPVESDLPMKTI